MHDIAVDKYLVFLKYNVSIAFYTVHIAPLKAKNARPKTVSQYYLT